MFYYPGTKVLLSTISTHVLVTNGLDSNVFLDPGHNLAFPARYDGVIVNDLQSIRETPVIYLRLSRENRSVQGDQ